MITLFWAIFNIVFILMNIYIMKTGQGDGWNYFCMMMHFLAITCLLEKEKK